MNNKKKFSRLFASILVLVLAISTTLIPKQYSRAASKNYMKGLELKWDLKNDKTVKYKTAYPEIGNQTDSVKMTKYKISDAKEKGYKKLTFTLTFNNDFEPTNSQLHKMVNSENRDMGGGFWYAIVDYDTGLSLEIENDFDVKVSAKSSYKNDKEYRDEDGCYTSFSARVSNVTITYPENYKGLCIGVGGYNQLINSQNNYDFWEGTKPFGKTSYYTKGKTNSHWMRVK